MSAPHPPTDTERFLHDPADFSLVLGGPLYQLWRRARLAGGALELLRRRVIALVVLTWVPPLVLSVAAGHAWGDRVRVPFLHDVELHIRLLLALPLLVVAELVVHRLMRPVVREFLTRELIPDAARHRFDAAISSALRLRNSVTAEALLLAAVFFVGVPFIWRTQLALDVSSWYGGPVGGEWQPSVAGWWLGLVSLPLFQFLLVRWYFRLFIWMRFLWHVSRIELLLMPTHPDRSGGVGFVAGVSHAFAPFMLAQGALLAGTIANRIFFAGATLPQFKLEIGGLVVVTAIAVLGPLLLFSRQLAAAKRVGLREYGALAQRYAREFDDKWLRSGAPANEPLIGSADIQSLADLGNSFTVVKEMRLVPFTLQTALQLALTTLAPVAPLALTMVPLDELLTRLLEAVF